MERFSSYFMAYYTRKGKYRPATPPATQGTLDSEMGLTEEL